LPTTLTSRSHHHLHQPDRAPTLTGGQPLPWPALKCPPARKHPRSRVHLLLERGGGGSPPLSGLGRAGGGGFAVPGLQRRPPWPELAGNGRVPPRRPASMVGARALARARHKRRKRRHKTMASHIKAARAASSSGGDSDQRGSCGGHRPQARGDDGGWRLGG